MSIPVIDTIKPLGNFPAIDSVDVNCDGIRLNTVLSTTAIELAKKINAEAVENTYAKKTDIPVVPTNVSEFINDAGYLTEHQSLAAYALKSEIPTVPTKVSQLQNDSKFGTYSKPSSGIPKSDLSNAVQNEIISRTEHTL